MALRLSSGPLIYPHSPASTRPREWSSVLWLLSELRSRSGLSPVGQLIFFVWDSLVPTVQWERTPSLPCHPHRPDVLPWTSNDLPSMGQESAPATAHGNQRVQSCAQSPWKNLAPQFVATSLCSGLSPPPRPDPGLGESQGEGFLDWFCCLWACRC